MEFWLFWIIEKLGWFVQDHIKTTQDVLHKATPTIFFLTMVSAFFAWSIIISNITTIIHMKAFKEKDSKIETLKTAIQIEKTRKRKNKNKSTECHPEIDWHALAQCFPIAGADSDFEIIA